MLTSPSAITRPNNCHFFMLSPDAIILSEQGESVLITADP
jgi:hypothetical protein